MNKILLAFKIRAFAMLWLGEIFTQVAINLLNFFLIFLVFSLTNSNTADSWLVIAITIPAIFFGLLAGVYVDRWNKKKVIIITNIVRAALLIVLAFFNTDLMYVYTIAFLVSLITQFFIPAESPIIPEVVEPKMLYSANALFSIGLYGSILIAYIISAPLLLYFSHFEILIFISVALVIGAFFISLIRIPKQKKKPLIANTEHAILEELKSVLLVIIKKPAVLHSLFFLAMTQILLLIIASIAPGYTSEVLNIDIKHFPIVFIMPAALGVVLGAALLTSIFSEAKKGKIITIGLFLSGLAILLMPYGSKIASRDFIHTLNTVLPAFLHISVYDLLTLFAFTLGLGNSFIFVPSNTLLQEETSEELRGKIYGVLNTMIGLLSLAPLIIVGGLADLVGVGRVLIGIGLGIILVGVWRIIIR